MKSLSLASSALLAIVALNSTAQAQCAQCNSGSLTNAYRAGYTQNVIWPSQFIPAARRSVHDAYAVVINNGWRRQNLLGNYHFEEKSNELTRAGKLKVKWILTQAPYHRRSVFVERASDMSETASRVASIHEYATNMSPNVGTVQVNDTHIVAEGHPAGAVDSVFVGFRANQPPPVLPADTGSSSSSGE